MLTSSPSQTTTSGELQHYRVWPHPSSLIFDENYFKFPWLVYNTCFITSRPFICDASEISPHAMLLFGGSIIVDSENGTIAVQTPAMIAAATAAAYRDGGQWVRFRADPHIGVLVKALRKRIDELLNEKINDPTSAIDKDKAILAAISLIITEGDG